MPENTLPFDHEGAPMLSNIRIPSIKADRHDLKMPPFVPILSQKNPIHTLPTYSLRSLVYYANELSMNIKPHTAPTTFDTPSNKPR